MDGGNGGVASGTEKREEKQTSINSSEPLAITLYLMEMCLNYFTMKGK